MSFVRTSCPARLYCTDSDSNCVTIEQPSSFMRFQQRRNFTMDDLANANPKPLPDERDLIARNCTNSPILPVNQTSTGACFADDSGDIVVRNNGLPVSVDDETRGDLATLMLTEKAPSGHKTNTPSSVPASDFREYDRVKAPEVDFSENRSAVEPSIRLQEQCNKADLDHGQLVDELNRTERERNNLLVRLIQFIRENAVLQEELQETRSVEAELRKQMQAMNANIGRLEDRLASLAHELDRSREINQSLQREKDSRAWKPTSPDLCTVCGNSSIDAKRMRQVSQIVSTQQQDLERMHTVVDRQRLLIGQLVKRLNIDDGRLSQQQLQQKDVVSSAPATSVSRLTRTVPVPVDELQFSVETIPVQVRDNAELPPNKLAASRNGPSEFFQTELQQPSAAAVKPVNKNSKLLHPDRKISNSVDSIRTPPTVNAAAASSDAYAPMPRSPRSISAVNARQIQSTVASSVQQQQQPGSSVKVRMLYPPTNCCPICQAPMPVDISSPDLFARHVDDCLQRVTKEVPIASDSSPARHKPTPQGAPVVDGVGGARNDLSEERRICPICSCVFPMSMTYEAFERHVDEHFQLSADEFEMLP